MHDEEDQAGAYSEVTDAGADHDASSPATPSGEEEDPGAAEEEALAASVRPVEDGLPS